MQHAASEARPKAETSKKLFPDKAREKRRRGGGGRGTGGYTAEFQARLADVRLEIQPEWSQWSRQRQRRRQGGGFTEQLLSEDPPAGLPLAGCSVNTN